MRVMLMTFFLPFLLNKAERRIHGATVLTFNLCPEKVKRTKQNKKKNEAVTSRQVKVQRCARPRGLPPEGRRGRGQEKRMELCPGGKRRGGAVVNSSQVQGKQHSLSSTLG